MQHHLSNDHLGWSEPEDDLAVDLGLSARVILFDDNVHTFDEVIGQIIRAVKCSYDRAEELTYEVHHTGRALVFEGQIAECLRVSGVLEEISLSTQVEY